MVFSRASAQDAYWAPLVLRVFSIGTIVVVVLVRRVNVRVDRRALLVIALIGTLDVLANLAYSVVDDAAAALDHGRAELALPAS